MLSVATIGEFCRSGLAIAGLSSIVFTVYSASGLPMPATMNQVDARIAPISEQIRSVKVLVMTGTRVSLDSKKAMLRNEKFTLERAMDTADQGARVTLNRRIGSITDEMTDIDRQDEDLRRTLSELAPKP